MESNSSSLSISDTYLKTGWTAIGRNLSLSIY